MAKGKHSTALFEVIQSGRGMDRGGSALRTPKWWFKGSQRPPEPEPAATEARAVSAPPAQTPPSEAEARTAPSAPAPKETAQRSAAPDHEPSLSRFGRSAVQFGFDAERHEVTVRLRYTTAIVGGFAVLVVVGLSYVLGRHLASGPQAAMGSPTTDELLSGPANPDAMDIARRADRPAGATSPARPATDGGNRPKEGLAVEAPLAPAPQDGRRVIGTNYIIVQSYPNEKKANDARDALAAANIPCTVEKAPPKWTADPNWYCVISSAGFQHPKSPEAESYVRAIQGVGEKFGGKQGFNRFEPHFYKW